MTGKLGKITRSKGGRGKTALLSDILEMWIEGRNLHLAPGRRSNQEFNVHIIPKDGLAYLLLFLVYKIALTIGRGRWKK